MPSECTQSDINFLEFIAWLLYGEQDIQIYKISHCYRKRKSQYHGVTLPELCYSPTASHGPLVEAIVALCRIN